MHLTNRRIRGDKNREHGEEEKPDTISITRREQKKIKRYGGKNGHKTQGGGKGGEQDKTVIKKDRGEDRLQKSRRKRSRLKGRGGTRY